MLFDLRGRGRRRTVQVIYLSLAILMGGGLVLFGIGGATSGGLIDAIQGGKSSNSSGSDTFQKRVDALEKQTQTDPTNARAWAQLAGLRFQLAGSGANYDQATQVYTDKGKAELRQASAAWQRHLKLAGDKPDPTVANQMVQAYGISGLQNYPEAVKALEFVIDATPNATFQQYAQLAVLAHGAKQDRKATLSADKAVSLAPKAQRKTLRDQIKAAQQQLDTAAGSTTTSGQ
jgi:tetratricopeptide (TPR) repeat protein